MTYFYYKTNTWNNSDTGITEETINYWKHLVDKKNWRITQLPNGFYQTEVKDRDDQWSDVTRRETIDGAEAAKFCNEIKKNLGKKNLHGIWGKGI